MTAVSTAVTLSPATPTHSACSATTARSERRDTPSARRAANSLIDARIAPLRVWLAITTPTISASSDAKPEPMPAPDSSSQ